MLHRLSVCMDFLQSKLQQGKTPHHFEQLLRSFSHYFLPFHSSPTEIMPNQYNSFSWSVMVKRAGVFPLFGAYKPYSFPRIKGYDGNALLIMLLPR